MSTHTWLFGYGSIIWRPAFDYLDVRPARLSGWRRRFWQGSIDHRGVPGAPGRVVTLAPEAGVVCPGVAYAVAAADAARVLADLDHREQGGYLRETVAVETADGAVVDAVTYIAHPDNPNFLGPAPLDAIARQVARAHGPSGPNSEYVMRLAAALRGAAALDDEVFTLESALLAHETGG